MTNPVVANIVNEAKRRRGKVNSKDLERITKSAFETARVEANFSNPSGGDGTSVGWRQETARSYPNVNRMDIKASVKRYFDEAIAAGPRKYGSAGQLSQAVQRSAYPGRYDQHAGEAQKLYNQYFKGSNKGSSGGKKTKRTDSGKTLVTTNANRVGGKDPKLVPATTKIDYSGAFVDALLTKPYQRAKGSLLSEAMNRIDSGAYTTSTPGKVIPGDPGHIETSSVERKVKGGIDSRALKKATSGASSVIQNAQTALRRGAFVYNSPTGGTAANGLREFAKTGKARVPATGGKTKLNPKMLAFLAAASKAGNLKINAIVNGKHTQGSNHYKGNAVDLDNSSGLGTARIVAIAKRYGGRKNYETSHIHLDF